MLVSYESGWDRTTQVGRGREEGRWEGGRREGKRAKENGRGEGEEGREGEKE